MRKTFQRFSSIKTTYKKTHYHSLIYKSHYNDICIASRYEPLNQPFIYINKNANTWKHYHRLAYHWCGKKREIIFNNYFAADHIYHNHHVLRHFLCFYKSPKCSNKIPPPLVVDAGNGRPSAPLIPGPQVWFFVYPIINHNRD